MNKKAEDGVQLRDHHSPANKISVAQKDFVKRHIKSYPKFTCHYSIKYDPNRECLDSSLNVHKMFELHCTK